MAVAVFDLRTGGGTIEFLADAPFDSTTLVLPVLIEQLCAAGLAVPVRGEPAVQLPRGDLRADRRHGGRGGRRRVVQRRSPRRSAPACSTIVAPNESATETVTVNAAEFAQTPPLGLMIVSHDNRNQRGGPDHPGPALLR